MDKEAINVQRILESKGIQSKIFEHKDPNPPDSIFIGKLVSAEAARIAIAAIPYSINYIFPLEYLEAHGGDPSGC